MELVIGSRVENAPAEGEISGPAGGVFHLLVTL
jgi:hypothetical protein